MSWLELRPKGRPAARKGAEARGGDEGGGVGPQQLPPDRPGKACHPEVSPRARAHRGLRPGVTGWVPKEQPLAQVKLLPEEGRATE